MPVICSPAFVRRAAFRVVVERGHGAGPENTVAELYGIDPRRYVFGRVRRGVSREHGDVQIRVLHAPVAPTFRIRLDEAPDRLLVVVMQPDGGAVELFNGPLEAVAHVAPERNASRQLTPTCAQLLEAMASVPQAWRIPIADLPPALEHAEPGLPRSRGCLAHIAAASIVATAFPLQSSRDAGLSDEQRAVLIMRASAALAAGLEIEGDGQDAPEVVDLGRMAVSQFMTVDPGPQGRFEPRLVRFKLSVLVAALLSAAASVVPGLPQVALVLLGGSLICSFKDFKNGFGALPMNQARVAYKLHAMSAWRGPEGVSRGVLFGELNASLAAAGADPMPQAEFDEAVQLLRAAGIVDADDVSKRLWLRETTVVHPFA